MATVSESVVRYGVLVLVLPAMISLFFRSEQLQMTAFALPFSAEDNNASVTGVSSEFSHPTSPVPSSSELGLTPQPERSTEWSSNPTDPVPMETTPGTKHEVSSTIIPESTEVNSNENLITPESSSEQNTKHSSTELTKESTVTELTSGPTPITITLSFETENITEPTFKPLQIVTIAKSEESSETHSSEVPAADQANTVLAVDEEPDTTSAKTEKSETNESTEGEGTISAIKTSPISTRSTPSVEPDFHEQPYTTGMQETHSESTNHTEIISSSEENSITAPSSNPDGGNSSELPEIHVIEHNSEETHQESAEAKEIGPTKMVANITQGGSNEWFPSSKPVGEDWNQTSTDLVNGTQPNSDEVTNHSETNSGSQTNNISATQNIAITWSEGPGAVHSAAKDARQGRKLEPTEDVKTETTSAPGAGSLLAGNYAVCALLAGLISLRLL